MPPSDRARDPNKLRLFAGAETIGILTVTDVDFTIVYADFQPLAGFETYRPMFDQLVRTFRSFGGPHEAALEALDLGLEEASGEIQRIRFLVIDGNKARWRIGAFRQEAPSD